MILLSTTLNSSWEVQIKWFACAHTMEESLSTSTNDQILNLLMLAVLISVISDYENMWCWHFISILLFSSMNLYVLLQGTDIASKYL